MKTTTSPLVKSFLTGEGILVYATNIAIALFAAIPHDLSWTHAGIFITITTGVNVLARTLLKITAIQKQYGVAPPVIDPVDPQQIEELLQQLTPFIENLVKQQVTTPVVAKSLTSAGAFT